MITLASLVLLCLPLASSFAAYPMKEHAYSAKSLQDFFQSNNEHNVLTQIPSIGIVERTEQLGGLKSRHFNTLRRHARHVNEVAETMASCLSPYNDDKNALCPFDPHLTLLLDNDIVHEAKAELRRIQEISLLVSKAMERWESEEGFIHLFPSIFDTTVWYQRAALLEHSSRPSLESIWRTVCEARLEFGQIELPSDSLIGPPQIGYDDLFEATSENVPAQLFVCVVLFFFFLDHVMIYICNPMVCRYVRMRMNYKCMVSMRLT